MNATIENSKNVTIDVQTKLNIYRLSNNNLQVVYKNEDATTTSFIRNRNKLLQQLLLLNIKVKHSNLLKKINHGGCGLFAYYAYNKLHELAKTDNKISSIQIVPAMSDLNGFYKKQGAIDGKKYYIMIDYNQSIVEQLIQMENENWAHFLVSFNYNKKKFYFDGKNLYSRSYKLRHSTDNKNKLIKSNAIENPDVRYCFPKHNITIDFLKEMIATSKHKKSIHKMNHPMNYCWSDSFLNYGQIKFDDVVNEIQKLLNEIEL